MTLFPLPLRWLVGLFWLLAAQGVTVAERVPHQLPANPHNARYLDTKRDRTGHLL